ncbi:DUF4416 family protein [Candidatus Margulisiibacteriota bacterium]
MGKIKKFSLVKFFIGIIYTREIFFLDVLQNLSDSFGIIDFISLPIKFDHTNYYEQEMGKGLTKRFISFYELRDVEKTPQSKIITNDIEEKYSQDSKRQINLDPGILSLPNIILFSTKNFTHRIPLNNNIYGEVTLLVHKKKFSDLPWTYPDFKSGAYKNVFYSIRDIYKNQLVDF